MQNVVDNSRVVYSYESYLALCEDLLAQGKTTGAIQTPDYVEYTRMSVQRMHRIHKTTEINAELKAALRRTQRQISLDGDFRGMVWRCRPKPAGDRQSRRGPSTNPTRDDPARRQFGIHGSIPHQRWARDPETHRHGFGYHLRWSRHGGQDPQARSK